MKGTVELHKTNIHQFSFVGHNPQEYEFSTYEYVLKIKPVRVLNNQTKNFREEVPTAG